MEFRIAADELKKALYRAQGIVERKTTMPILANVLVTANKAASPSPRSTWTSASCRSTPQRSSRRAPSR